MSYSFKLKDGDLALGGHRSCETVEGAEKLYQDLQLWLYEEVGTDRFHPKFGVSLKDKIGSLNSDLVATQVKGEVMRALRKYQKMQETKIKREKWTYVNQRPQEQYWLTSKEEVLVAVNGVDLTRDKNILNARVSVTTLSGKQLVFPYRIDLYKSL